MRSARKGIKRFLKEAGIEYSRVSNLRDFRYKIIIQSGKQKEELHQIIRSLTAYLSIPIERLSIYYRKAGL